MFVVLSLDDKDVKERIRKRHNGEEQVVDLMMVNFHFYKFNFSISVRLFKIALNLFNYIDKQAGLKAPHSRFPLNFSFMI